jgi:hypothetical protein
MKSYTNIEQSKKLTEILPLDSTDFCYIKTGVTRDNWMGIPEYQFKPMPHKDYSGESIGCWSLAALLSVIPSRLFDSTPKRKELYLLPDLDKSYCFYRQFAVKTKGEIYLLTEGECLVDACYEMILKLHELNLL